MANNIANIASLAVSLVLITIALTGFGKARAKMKKAEYNLAQSELDKLAIQSELIKLSNQLDEMKIEQSEGFVRFLSESRDWAYQYIDAIQEEFPKDYALIKNKLSNETISLEDKKQISEALEKMKSLILPEETITPNN